MEPPGIDRNRPIWLNEPGNCAAGNQIPRIIDKPHAALNLDTLAREKCSVHMVDYLTARVQVGETRSKEYNNRVLAP